MEATVLNKIFGKKAGMTQIFNDAGEAVPVTVLEVEDHVVMGSKDEAKEGYNAIRIGTINEKKPKNVTKPMKGNFKNEKKGLNLDFKRVVREIRTDKETASKFKAGDIINVDSVFKKGDFVDVSAVSKGKGTQGVIKRHNFRGGSGSHGGMNHRGPGSIGSNTFPARVLKNKKMAGQMGNERVTTMNLKVEEVDSKNRYMLVRGSVPGGKNGLVEIRKTVKKK